MIELSSSQRISDMWISLFIFTPISKINWKCTNTIEQNCIHFWAKLDFQSVPFLWVHCRKRALNTNYSLNSLMMTNKCFINCPSPCHNICVFRWKMWIFHGKYYFKSKIWSLTLMCSFFMQRFFRKKVRLLPIFSPLPLSYKCLVGHFPSPFNASVVKT